MLNETYIVHNIATPTTTISYLLQRSSDLSNSGEFKRQTASEIAIEIHSSLRNCSDTQSVS